MLSKLIKILLIILTINIFINTGNHFVKAEENKPEIIIFIRDGCGNCRKEEEFLKNNETIKNNFKVRLLNIKELENRKMWRAVVEKYNLSKVTPITLVGGNVLVGFDRKVTTKEILKQKDNQRKYNLDFYLQKKNPQSVSSENEYVCQVDSTSACSLQLEKDFKKKNFLVGTNKEKNNQKGTIDSGISEEMILPFFGQISIKQTSLFLMSSVLGFIDGFNPCAMWVLLTFLIILSQIGDKKKMIYLTGIFLLAEAIMYFLILNIWYQTWDFIQLDQFVTPLVGVIAVISGIYFLYKYFKNRNKKLVCEVTSLEHQQKTVNKIKEVVKRPITLATIGAVLFLAFSVNVIEFACSVGIAQSFTKILELNQLNFIMRQWYIFIYTVFYMADDFLIFGLAIFGYQKFAGVGTKYSHLSSLAGGLLMILLGILLLLKPGWLG